MARDRGRRITLDPFKRPFVGPALVFAPMDGVTDVAMRDVQGALGAFTYAVGEFVRVSVSSLPAKVFRRDVPELLSGGRTSSGLPVQVQLLGGDPERMAATAEQAVVAGAQAIDINFGCPAPTVNRNDGGATLLKFPERIREIVAAVRAATPNSVPVSAKLRLGWEQKTDFFVNALMAEAGGADWITVHARTRLQGYAPPVDWELVGEVRKRAGIPIVANGDIWTLDNFLRCRDLTGCDRFMIGRGALANPALPGQIAIELGLPTKVLQDVDWVAILSEYRAAMDRFGQASPIVHVARLKQWIKFAHRFGDFPWFDELKLATCPNDLMERLRDRQNAAVRKTCPASQ